LACLAVTDCKGSGSGASDTVVVGEHERRREGRPIVQGDIGSLTPEDVRKYRLGSVCAGGNSDPGGDFHATAAQWVALADTFHEASMETSRGHTAIPVLFDIDDGSGRNDVVAEPRINHCL